MVSPRQYNHHPRLLLWRLLWSTPILLLLLLLLLQDHATVQAYPGMVKKIDQDPRPRLLRAKEVASMLQEMRQGDYRLVRPSPTKETETEQHVYCPYKIPSFLMTLCTSTAGTKSPGRMAVSLHKRGLAAEALAMCLTDQPPFRDVARNTTFFEQELNAIQRGQLVAHSLAEGLTVLLQESLAHYHETKSGASVLAASQAAEAVWISSYHHPGHIADYLQHDTLSILADWIVSVTPPNTDAEGHDTNTDPAYPYHPARAVMWASAALQNLAANYCANELGYCIWEWRRKQEQEHVPSSNTIRDNHNAVLVLDEDTTLEAPELAEQARQQIAAYPNLLQTLVKWVCRGPIDQMPSDTYGWPGEAQLWKDLTFNAASLHLQSPSIVPWAAAGVLKNLLLSPTTAVREQVQSLSHLHQCLCEMKWSPDWLEHGKASAALHLWSSQDSCPSIYDDCRDDTNWANAESGDTCEEYTNERWCIEYGDDVGNDGKRAKEACCLCGGGYRGDIDDEDDGGDTGEGGAEKEGDARDSQEATITEDEMHDEL